MDPIHAVNQTIQIVPIHESNRKFHRDESERL